MTEKKDKTYKNKSFEKALERLEKIVGDMEGGSLSLDDMVGRFEEGQELIEFCGKTLNEVERKIEKLVKKGDKVVAEPFEDEPTNDDESNGELF
ncbi:MAG: exodeoxyribonuclease VII small subunit [Kiritimatiellae bacterium]|nr:exodeoxyribonuclease VII small subunit [Kiritimatiellia bacterium]